ncbi:MAG: hypothetical protein JRH20_09230 [Deltaproteobacteria bacterium]|nr:hypothetical protein [Deltaproteobacteria bacterium]
MARKIVLTFFVSLLALPALAEPKPQLALCRPKPLLALPAPHSPSRIYVKKHRALGARKHLSFGRIMVELPTKERGPAQSYEHYLKHTVELLYNPNSRTGHELLRVGDLFGDLGYTHQAQQRNLPNFAHRKSGMVGFVFDVKNTKALDHVQSVMRREIESMKRYNVPVFSGSSGLVKLRAGSEGRFSVEPTGRRSRFGDPSGIVEGKLVTEAGKLFLRSPNGIMTPAKKVGELIEVETRSCTSWPTDLLARFGKELGLPNFAVRKDSRRLAAELMRSPTPMVKPDLVTVYTSTPGGFDMENVAKKIGTLRDARLAQP